MTSETLAKFCQLYVPKGCLVTMTTEHHPGFVVAVITKEEGDKYSYVAIAEAEINRANKEDPTTMLLQAIIKCRTLTALTMMARSGPQPKTPCVACGKTIVGYSFSHPRCDECKANAVPR